MTTEELPDGSVRLAIVCDKCGTSQTDVVSKFERIVAGRASSSAARILGSAAKNLVKDAEENGFQQKSEYHPKMRFYWLCRECQRAGTA